MGAASPSHGLGGCDTALKSVAWLGWLRHRFETRRVAWTAATPLSLEWTRLLATLFTFVQIFCLRSSSNPTILGFFYIIDDSTRCCLQNRQ